jgi:hypothetical protein
MVMRKILFGSIVFFSLAFLAACGGGGSGSNGAAGSAGSAGADGAAGATGSIAVFEDADLTIAYNGAAGAVAGSTPTAVPLDTGSVMGKISGLLNINGMDNSTANSRNRYYMYANNSAGAKILLKGATVLETSSGIYDITSGTAASDGMIDNRLSTSTASSIVLANWADSGVAGTTYLASTFSVCPGNEAGDGACANVKAPAYDRGIGTLTAIANADGTSTAALAGSITYAGAGFHVIGDNGSTTDSNAQGATGWRLSAAKTGFGSALTSDNTSVALQTEALDNNTMVSNSITRGSTVWIAMAADNASTVPLYDGQNVSLASRTDLVKNFTDNVTKTEWTHIAPMATAPQISNAGDGIYVMMQDNVSVVHPWLAYDNTTVGDLGNVTLTASNLNWCSTATGALLVTDNGTDGWTFNKVLDNGTTTVLSGPTVASGIDDQVAASLCAVTYLGNTFYLAAADVITGGDNISVWKSTDATTWTQIGSDFKETGSDGIDNLAIATTGSSAADGNVWITYDNSSFVSLIHYEDIAGGSNPVWRNVHGSILTGNPGSLSIATDGTSIIGVTGVIGTITKVGFWYNQ